MMDEREASIIIYGAYPCSNIAVCRKDKVNDPLAWTVKKAVAVNTPVSFDAEENIEYEVRIRHYGHLPFSEFYRAPADVSPTIRDSHLKYT